MSECVFCRIVSGEIPSTRLWEDEQVVAFLDINPLAAGHTLVVPRVHAERLTELPPEVVSALIRPVPALAEAILAATGAEGFNILQNNGSCGGRLGLSLARSPGRPRGTEPSPAGHPGPPVVRRGGPAVEERVVARTVGCGEGAWSCPEDALTSTPCGDECRFFF